jgi:hypothetical protein
LTVGIEVGNAVGENIQGNDRIGAETGNPLERFELTRAASPPADSAHAVTEPIVKEKL